MKIRVADAIAKTLEAMGTEQVFGYNGHGNWALLDAFVHETNVATTATRSEDYAVHMADCWWRMRRQPPMAVATTSVGPGNANIVPALATAFFESSALLVLAGGGATQWYDRGGIEEFYRFAPEEWTNSLRLFTKKALTVTRPDTTLEMLLRAYKTAVSGRPGPVVVQIPFDIQHTEIELDAIPDGRRWTEIAKPAPDPAAVAAAAKLIATAERPLLVVSSGVHNARAWDELRAFAEAYGIPVETTAPGKGALPESHPLALGCVGRNGTGQANQAARECDVLIGIGTRFGDIDTGGWSIHDIPGKTKLVHVDIDDGELARVYPTDVAIAADARLALVALHAAVAEHEQRDRGPWHERIADLRRAWLSEVEPLRTSDATPLPYAPVFSVASQVINDVDPDATVLFDTGHALSFGPPFLEALSPNYIHSGFFHRMGWSVPGLIGARLARPDHPAVAFVGDGSFIMTGSSLLTAVELGLPTVYVVLDNRTLQVERELMLRKYGRHALTDYVREDSGEAFGPDFVQWAESCGAAGVRVARLDELEPALRTALGASGPTVISVDIDPESPGYRAIHYPYPDDFASRGLEHPAV